MKLTHMLCLGALLANLSACKTDDALDTTIAMGNKMDEQLKKTEEMSVKMDTQLRKTEYLHVQSRLKETEETRDRRFKNLLNSKSFIERTIHAGAYIKSFEFQLWFNEGYDSDEFRLYLMGEALNEIFRATGGLLDQSSRPEEISPANGADYAQSLYAIAIALHELNSFQEYLTHKDSIEEVSLLDMIKDALSKRADVRSGEITEDELNAFEIMVFRNEAMAIKLLEMRYNIMPALILGMTSDINKKSSWYTLGIPTIARKLGMLRKSWASDYTNLNPIAQSYINDIAEEAIKTKNFLKDIGVNPNLDSKVKKILKNMKIKKTRSSCSVCQENIETINKKIESILK